MNNDKGFDIIISFVFAMSNQLGGLGPKPQDLLISFSLDEGETLPQFHLRDLISGVKFSFCKIKNDK